MPSFPLEEPSPPRKSTGAGVKIIVRVLVSTIFILSCYGAGKLAINMVSRDLPQGNLTMESPSQQSTVSLQGSREEPLFMGSDKEAVRAFFANNTNLESRIKASLQNTGIRKIEDLLEVQTMRSEADAIQVRVTSGAVAGAVYWVHHSQMKKDPVIDSIISPIPTDLQGTDVPGGEILGTGIPRTDVPGNAVPEPANLNE